MKSTTSTSSAARRQLPDDRSVPLPELLDENAMTSRLNAMAGASPAAIEGLRIGHVRYDPGVSCTVTYDARCALGGRRHATTLYAKSSGGKRHAKERARAPERRWIRGVLFQEPFALKEICAMVYEFPNDAKLESLGLLGTPNALTEFLHGHMRSVVPDPWRPGDEEATWRPLRYKPEHRFVAQCDTHWLDRGGNARETLPIVLRFERPEKTARAAALLERLRDAFEGHPVVGTPTLVFSDTEREILAVGVLPGSKLSDVLAAGEARQAVERTARALALLHDHNDDSLPRHEAALRIGDALESASALGRFDDRFRSRTDRVAEKLRAVAARSGPSHVGFVHGDFHQGQVLCSGERVHFLDFERSHTGETATDVGNFLGQVEALRIKKRTSQSPPWEEWFLEAYEATAARPLARDRLAMWSVVSLLDLAAREPRRLRPNWRDKVVTILDRCVAILNGEA